ncbi:hypothetical protein [Stenotrophomonas sepilia]
MIRRTLYRPDIPSHGGTDDANEAVLENPASYFPQGIRYRRLNEQRAHARTEVAQDDPEQAMDSPLHCLACGGPAPTH